jgi:DNA (cytosine-5)-methyltransferase 1
MDANAHEQLDVPAQQALDFPAQKVEELEACEPLKVAGLFAGIGGIELGLSRAGHKSQLLCEIDLGAQAILNSHFPHVEIVGDVTEVTTLPNVELVSAGFPCQDLSQAGRLEGIKGKQSGLVGEVFRLIEDPTNSPTWLLLENVPFMLSLDKGEAMKFLTRTLSDMGFTWAYRIVDTRAFGLPQRRHRVIMLASRTEDPRTVLFADDVDGPHLPEDGDAFGFYWTEGRTGVGWGIEATPPLKKGSTVGIPSPPAVWLRDERVMGKPDIRDAERLQGFEENWTKPAAESGATTDRGRWSYVGNAVSVPVSEWLGHRLRHPVEYHGQHRRLKRSERLPRGAAWGREGVAYEVNASTWPVRADYQPLSQFLKYPLEPLSVRAASGFLKRAREGNLNFHPGFLDAVEQHIERMKSKR